MPSFVHAWEGGLWVLVKVCGWVVCNGFLKVGSNLSQAR